MNSRNAHAELWFC